MNIFVFLLIIQEKVKTLKNNIKWMMINYIIYITTNLSFEEKITTCWL